MVEIHHPEEVFSGENGEEEMEKSRREYKPSGKCRKPLPVPSKLEKGERKKGKENMNPHSLRNAKHNSGGKLFLSKKDENAEEKKSECKVLTRVVKSAQECRVREEKKCSGENGAETPECFPCKKQEEPPGQRPKECREKLEEWKVQIGR